MTEVFMYRASLLCQGHGEERKRQLARAVEDGEIRCPNFEDSEAWPVAVDPFAVEDDDYCSDCVAVALSHHWPISIALLNG
jgi:hypothetical protein